MRLFQKSCLANYADDDMQAYLLLCDKIALLLLEDTPKRRTNQQYDMLHDVAQQRARMMLATVTTALAQCNFQIAVAEPEPDCD